MKVSFEGKVRKVTEWPVNLDELKKIVSRKFTERSLIEEYTDESQISSIMNQTSKPRNKRKQLIDWSKVNMFYEDSEGDLNVISEEEDLTDAHTYAKMKLPKPLKLSIIDLELFKVIR